MTQTVEASVPEGRADTFTGRLRGLTRAQRTLGLGLLVMLVMTTARVLANANDLTSSGTVAATLRLSAPLICAGLAALWAERVGIVNIGIEGMMILGTWAGGFGAWKYGPWYGLLFGIIAGSALGLIHALATVRFNVDHVISGVAINIFAPGAARFLSEQIFTPHGGGASNSPPQRAAIPSINVPFIAGGRLFGWRTPNIAGWFEKHHWFLISDIAGVVRGLGRDVSFATLIILALVPVSAWILWRTRFGLRLRSSGEAPAAASSLGVNIPRLRYQGMAISGALAGLGGAFLAVVASNLYREGQTGGQGFIGLATTIFGNWRPVGVLSGGLLFGFATALRLRDAKNVPALFLVLAMAFVVLAILSLRKRHLVAGGVSLVCAILAAVGFVTINELPQALTFITPHVITLIVLASASQRLRPPAFAGRPYREGESH
ncbi:MAG: ral nucleoside transport system permease protein [Ilumatobacteraceae bacterium]|jgi:simple sugar transport system permease protein|nr:ral nucleoside transport system permease protein [Ilumatobacteraceae bacterium]